MNAHAQIEAPTLTELLEAMPEYTAAAGAAARLRRIPLPTVDELVDTMRDRLTAWMLDEDPASAEEFADELAALGARINAREIVTNQIMRLAESTRRLPKAVQDRNAGTLLGELGKSMRTVIAAAREVGTDGAHLDLNRSTVTDAEIAQSRSIRALAQTYSQLRADQQQLLGNPTSYPRDFNTLAAIIRNVEDVWPEYADVTAHRVMHRVTRPAQNEGMSGDYEPAAPPWQTFISSGRRLTLQDSQDFDFFVWAVDAGADLWIPTPRQHTEETERLRGLVSAVPGSEGSAPFVSNNPKGIASRATIHGTRGLRPQDLR